MQILLFVISSIWMTQMNYCCGIYGECLSALLPQTCCLAACSTCSGLPDSTCSILGSCWALELVAMVRHNNSAQHKIPLWEIFDLEVPHLADGGCLRTLMKSEALSNPSLLPAHLSQVSDLHHRLSLPTADPLPFFFQQTLPSIHLLYFCLSLGVCFPEDLTRQPWKVFSYGGLTKPAIKKERVIHQQMSAQTVTRKVYHGFHGETKGMHTRDVCPCDTDYASPNPVIPANENTLSKYVKESERITLWWCDHFY